MKKKVGIITILNVNNYGAELQAFALQQKLNEMGYDAEIINYVFYKNPGFKMEKGSLPFPINRLRNKIRDFILLKIDQLGSLLYPNISKKRKDNFTRFHSKWTKTSKPFYSQSQLYSEKHSYDVFIVGSDQVWNPNNGVNIEPYFLTFAPNNRLKISYASSFGVEKINLKLHDFYKKNLLNLDSIAVRETSGVRLIDEIAGKKAAHVVDPTVLLTSEDWKKFETEFSDSVPYIVVFVFKNSKFIDKVVNELSRKTGYKVYRICKNEFKVDKSSSGIINLRDLGPAEFLGVYRKASFIVTSSFHGTVFSLLFEKKFITVGPSSKDNNVRQINLLEDVGLRDRFLFEDSTYDIDNFLVNIDYHNINEKISISRKVSIDFLSNNLA